MAEILSAETLKATKVGKIKEAKMIIKKLVDAEKDQTKTAKPNAAKLKKWQTAKEAYEQTETKARALHAKITKAHPDLLNGKDVLNVTINEMQAALAKLDPEKRNAILNGSGIDEIQDVKLNNSLFEKEGALSNLGGDFLKGGDKSVAVSKAFTGVAIASFAASGVASVFHAATGKALTGALLKDGAMTALKFLGKNVLLPIWEFNPVGTALIAAVVAMKVIPVIARFVNKMKNKYAALTRAKTMKNQLAELAEQEGQSVEFENEFTARDSGKGEQVHTTGGNGGKDTGNPNPEKPQSLRQRMKGKTDKEQTAMFRNASLEEQIGYARESLEQCETELIGIEKNVNEFVAQYNKTSDPKMKKDLEPALATSAGQAKNIASELEGTLGIITTLLTNNPNNAELQELQKAASAKVETLRVKATAIQTACKKKEPVQSEGERKLKETPQTAGGGRKPGKRKQIEESSHKYQPRKAIPTIEAVLPKMPDIGAENNPRLKEAMTEYLAKIQELQTFASKLKLENLPPLINDVYGVGVKTDKDGESVGKNVAEIEADKKTYAEKRDKALEKFVNLQNDITDLVQEMKILTGFDPTFKGLASSDVMEKVKKLETIFIDMENHQIAQAISSKQDFESAYNRYMAEADKNIEYAKADSSFEAAEADFNKYAQELPKLDDLNEIEITQANLAFSMGELRRIAKSDKTRDITSYESLYDALKERAFNKIIDLKQKAEEARQKKIEEDLSTESTKLAGTYNKFKAAKTKDDANKLLDEIADIYNNISGLAGNNIKHQAVVETAERTLEAAITEFEEKFEKHQEKPKASGKFVGMSREQKIAEALKRFEDLNLSAKRYEKGNDEGGFGYVTDSKKLPEGQSYAFTVIDEMGLDEADKEVIYKLLHTALESRKGQQAQDVKRGKDAIKNNKNLEDAYNRAKELIEE